jgi:DnaJ-class molecular chaperone
VLDALTAEREARIREVAELREQKDAWINRLEAESERMRVALERIASQTFLDDPAQARRVARETLMKKCPTCSGVGVSANEPQACTDCLGTGTI